MAGQSNFIETWLDSNPEWFEEYFLRNGNRTMVQKWTEKQVFGNGKGPANAHLRGVSSPGPGTPKRKTVSLPDHDEKGDIFPIDDPSILARPRSGSRQYLRQDFAKARSKTVFHTWGSPSSNLDNLTSLDQRDMGPTSPPLSDHPARGMGRRGQLRRASTVPPERHAVSMLSVLLEPKVRLPHRISITNEDKIRLRETGNEREFFLTLVKDISHDLDLNFLKDKIVSNVCILVGGSNCALFLLEGPPGREKLVYTPPSSLRNNEWNNSNNDGSIKIALGENLVGGVAESGRAVLVEKPEEGLPYLREAESVIGYKVDSLMCMPIRNSEDDVIGVALVLNKTSGKAFTEDDEKLLETYLTFCGIGISNAQLFDTYMKEYDRNRKLLEVAHDLFEEQTCLDNVVQKIMQRAQSLLKCERCSVMLVKDPNAEEVSFSKVFDLPTLHNGHTNPMKATGDVKVTNGIIEQVALTGDTINIYDAQNDPRFDKELDKTMGFHTKSILCMPIRDNKYQIIEKKGKKVKQKERYIGVFQILNRTDGFPFDENDESLFEAFTIFCGLGINNTQNYNEVAKAMARQKVALEVLSYHACSSPSEVRAVQAEDLSSEMDRISLTRFDFDDFLLDADDMLRATFKMYTNSGLLQKFKIDDDTMCRWLLTVRKNYRPVAYHNFRHAFNVQQAMFSVLQNTPMCKYLTDMEQLTLLVGCLCHDLDHRGTNNAFQEKSQSALSQLYGSKATMEYHHFNHAVMILSSQGHNIFSNFNSEQYSEVMNILKHSILATDLALHIKVRGEFFQLLKNSKPNWSNQHHKELLRGMLMTACDVAASTKPWRIQQKIAELVTTEFFDQGDKERNELNLEPTSMFDRRNKDELPEMQLGFLDGICIPLYEVMTQLSADFQPMLDGVKSNRIKWAEQKDIRKKHKPLEKANSKGAMKPSKLPVSKPFKS